MSDKLPVVSGEKAIKALVKLGFVVRRQRSNHVVLQKNRIVFAVPLHSKLKKGTLRAILRQAEISIKEFKEQL